VGGGTYQKEGKDELDLGNSLRRGSLGIHQENGVSNREVGLNGEVLSTES